MRPTSFNGFGVHVNTGKLHIGKLFPEPDEGPSTSASEVKNTRATSYLHARSNDGLSNQMSAASPNPDELCPRNRLADAETQ